jgi:hypothetical protein
MAKARRGAHPTHPLSPANSSRVVSCVLKQIHEVFSKFYFVIWRWTRNITVLSVQKI